MVLQLQEMEESAAPSCDLRLGERVVFLGDREEMATVRWIGFLPDDPSMKNLIVGVEFDRPVGSGTGRYKDERLFFTKHGHAGLLPVDGLIKAEDYQSGQGTSSESQ